MAAWPTLSEVRTFLRMAPDPESDQVIGWALAAAIDYGVNRFQRNGAAFVYPPDTTTLPDPIHMACVQHAARLYRRRDSIDGTIWGGDAGAIRVGRRDPDAEALYAGYALVVFG